MFMLHTLSNCGAMCVMQDVLHNNGNRQELLLSVWRAFLSLAEHALKVSALLHCQTQHRHVSYSKYAH